MCFLLRIEFFINHLVRIAIDQPKKKILSLLFVFNGFSFIPSLSRFVPSPFCCCLHCVIHNFILVWNCSNEAHLRCHMEMPANMRRWPWRPCGIHLVTLRQSLQLIVRTPVEITVIHTLAYRFPVGSVCIITCKSSNNVSSADKKFSWKQMIGRHWIVVDNANATQSRVRLSCSQKK